jgi:enoyl-CoA hydratase
VSLQPFRTIRYEVVDPGDEGVAVITLDRPESRNAQDKQMTYELDEAFMDAARRTDVKVVVLQAEGPHFCSGHDLRDTASMRDFPRVGPYDGFGREGHEGYLAYEEEIYLHMCWRWRNLPKPVVAAAQGKTIAGGLMLLWVCDVIVASDDAQFSDPTVGMGVNGVEYFAHPWELGPRKAKELLFTGDWFTAEEARQLGMVNQVVPRAELHDATMALARRIAKKPSFALKLAKESVNQTLEAMGQWTAFKAAFSLQHLGHAHNKLKYGMLVDPSALGPKKPAAPEQQQQQQ